MQAEMLMANFGLDIYNDILSCTNLKELLLLYYRQEKNNLFLLLVSRIM